MGFVQTYHDEIDVRRDQPGSPTGSSSHQLHQEFAAAAFQPVLSGRKARRNADSSFALFKIERARAQIPVQKLTAPDVKVQAFLSE